jgi:hypothetical protein
LRERLKTFRQADTRADTERLLEYLRSHRFRIKRFAFCGVGSLLGLLGCTGYYYNELLVKPYNAKVNGAYGPLADRIPKLQEEVTKDIKGKKA